MKIFRRNLILQLMKYMCSKFVFSFCFYFENEKWILDLVSQVLFTIIYRNSENTLTKFKIFFSRTTEPISTKHGTKHPLVKGIQVCSNEGLHPFSRGEKLRNSEKTLTKLKNPLLQKHLANFNQIWQKASFSEGDSILFK